MAGAVWGPSIVHTMCAKAERRQPFLGLADKIGLTGFWPMFNGWKITNILDVGLCELDTADGPYNKTGYRLEHREDGFAITVGLMEYISGWSALEILCWMNEKQAIPRRYDNARRH